MNKSFSFVAIILLATVVVVSGCIGQNSSSTINNTNIQNNTQSTEVTPAKTCNNYFWYDGTNESCNSQKEFCGGYSYKGLNTFETKEQCIKSVSDLHSTSCEGVRCPGVFWNGTITACQCPQMGSESPPAPPSDQVSAPQPNTTVQAKTVMIDIKNFAFSPTTITINKGDTITWTNSDTAPHTVTSDSGTELASNTLNKGDIYSHTFNELGTFAYHCAFHSGMKATVVVE